MRLLLLYHFSYYYYYVVTCFYIIIIDMRSRVLLYYYYYYYAITCFYIVVINITLKPQMPTAAPLVPPLPLHWLTADGGLIVD
jgi:hypothetical protein